MKFENGFAFQFTSLSLRNNLGAPKDLSLGAGNPTVNYCNPVTLGAVISACVPAPVFVCCDPKDSVNFCTDSSWFNKIPVPQDGWEQLHGPLHGPVPAGTMSWGCHHVPALFQGITITNLDFCGVIFMKTLLCLDFSHPARNSCGKEVISGLVLTSGQSINFPLSDRFIGVFFI